MAIDYNLTNRTPERAAKMKADTARFIERLDRVIAEQGTRANREIAKRRIAEREAVKREG